MKKIACVLLIASLMGTYGLASPAIAATKTIQTGRTGGGSGCC